MRGLLAPLLVATATVLAGCGGATPHAEHVDVALLPPHFGAHSPAAPAGVTPADFTVLVFYSPSCHCLAAHDARLAALAARYGGRGVDFLLVDSGKGADEASDREDARRRGYPFPLVVDPGGRIAAQAHAEYASYAVLVNRDGRVLYQGGIDSDEHHLHDDATPYLADAIDDALAGRPVRRPEAKALGCALRTW